MSTLTFSDVKFARKMPDPENPTVSRHWWTVRAKDLPTDIPSDPNPRTPGDRIEKGIYRTVEASALGQEGTPGTFHNKNRGIRIAARKVVANGEHGYHVELADPNGSYTGDGAFDGSSTYELLLQAREELPAETWVDVFVTEGAPKDLVIEMAEAHNTGMQVKEYSLLAKRGAFDRIQSALDGTQALGNISFYEGDEGEIGIREVIAIETLFNTKLFPTDGSDQPVVAYYSKAATLKRYIESRESFDRLGVILPEILDFHDYVQAEAANYHEGKFGKLGYVTFGETTLPFSGRKSKYRIAKGALYPILAAFRCMVTPNGKTAKWTGSYDAVQGVWARSAQELLGYTRERLAELDGNINALGKDRAHWRLLAKTVQASR
jgi:hypothetical protein